jgi:hypothetical protein
MKPTRDGGSPAFLPVDDHRIIQAWIIGIGDEHLLFDAGQQPTLTGAGLGRPAVADEEARRVRSTWSQLCPAMVQAGAADSSSCWQMDCSISRAVRNRIQNRVPLTTFRRLALAGGTAVDGAGTKASAWRWIDCAQSGSARHCQPVP